MLGERKHLGPEARERRLGEKPDLLDRLAGIDRTRRDQAPALEFELRAVGGESGGQARGDARRQIAAERARGEQDDGGARLLLRGDDGGGIALALVAGERRVRGGRTWSARNGRPRTPSLRCPGRRQRRSSSAAP
jgi:hypothetical protein